MKFFVPLVCCLAFVRGTPLGGQSVSSRSQDDWGNYQFGYDIVDEHGAQNGREEKGDAHGNKVGSYTIKDNDGRSRRVDYVADAHGFRATIGTNEPGTATSHVGDATYLSSAPIITAEPARVLSVAPAHYAPAHYAAPLQYAAPLAVAHSAPLLAQSAPLLRSYSAPLLSRGYGHGGYGGPAVLAAPQWGHGPQLVSADPWGRSAW